MNEWVTGQLLPDLRALIAHGLIRLALRIAPADHPFTKDVRAGVRWG